MDDTKHPALLLVDTISSLASSEFCHDDWGVDVTISGSQKGLMQGSCSFDLPFQPSGHWRH